VHIAEIKRFTAKLFPDLQLPVEFAWTHVYGLSLPLVPVIKFGKTKVLIGGCGTQVVATLAAKYAVNHLLGRKQSLDRFFIK
jgi:hypothetical protein